MIAEVYPLKRMPRKFGVFDYSILAETSVQRGDLVEIPFRTSTILGVVAQVKDLPPRGIVLKQLSKIETDFFISDRELAYFERIAHDTAQSVSSVLHAALPTPPKRKTTESAEKRLSPITLTIPAQEAPSLRRIIEQIEARGEGFIQVYDVRRMAAIISGYFSRDQGQLITVIAPSVRDAHLLARSLFGHSPLLITGQESNNSRYQTWAAWRSRESGILVGTRLLALFPDRRVTTIFLVRSGNENHKQSDRNPRYDTRIATWLMHEQFKSKLFYLDAAPRADELALFSETNRLQAQHLPAPVIVSMNKERPTAPHPALGSTSAKAIAETLANGKRVLCICNKKGVSTQLRCRDCNRAFPCSNCAGPLRVYEHSLQCHRCGASEPIPLSCPACSGTNLKFRGYGNRSIKKVLEKLFSGHSVSIVEKGSVDMSGSILVVTQYYFENIWSPFDRSDIGLIIDLNADQSLFEPSLRAMEHAMLSLESWRGVAHAMGATYLLQSDVPELFESYLLHPEKSLEQELEMRAALGQPPARRWMRITHRSDEGRKSEIAVHALLKEILRQANDANIVGPKWNNKNRLSVDVGIHPTSIQTILELFGTLDDDFIIDTNLVF